MRTLAVVAVVLCLVSVASAQPAAKPAPPADPPALARRPPPPPPGYQIAGLHAFLYFHKTGTFGAGDLIGGQVALWNTIIGEGDAEHPSTSILVKVDVSGPGFAGVAGKVTVVAKAGKRTLAKQTFALADYFDEHGPQITLPMLVPGTGCGAVTLTATLTGKGKRSRATAQIPFACGE